jgi:AcrR family transcriptional regulator
MPEDDIFRTTLPPGRHRLPRDFVEQHQRARLFAALVRLVDEQGYPATSLTQIVKTAGVARHTFYEHFEDKEALFLALFDQTAEMAIRDTSKAVDAETGPWEAKIRAGVECLLTLIAQEPALTRVCLIESQSAGAAAVSRRNEAMRRFGVMLKKGREDASPGAELPESLEDILLGGVAWMINKRLASDEQDVEGMLPEILEFLIAPYRGNAAAREVARPEARHEHRPARGD